LANKRYTARNLVSLAYVAAADSMDLSLPGTSFYAIIVFEIHVKIFDVPARKYRARQKSYNSGDIKFFLGVNFFTKFTEFTAEDSGHISCKFHWNIWLHSKIITI